MQEIRKELYLLWHVKYLILYPTNFHNPLLMIKDHIPMI